ncbi:MAG TPA: siroheme synthase CysG [Steroidobacteraceae bacterium]|nr:siroheme synthase CysG [Steroidobacteraceae bacterium]
MRYFPLFLDLRERLVVIVGGGPVAERKLELVRRSGARLRLVAPALCERLARALRAGRFEHCARGFIATDLDGARLAIAAADDPSINRAVAAAAEARGIYVNVVDDPALCSAILPAIVDRSPLVVAISTLGTAPALARLVRERVESALDESIGSLARFCAVWRARIKAGVKDLGARRRFYDWLLRGPVSDLVRHAREADAGRLVATALAAGVPPGPGSVALVGAGPGDPGLLTLRGLRALQSADVVLHDRLVSPEVLGLARREAELIAVGKGGGTHGVAQAHIHELMVEHARRGRRVVRLKGGDPFVFGRGGEELEHLVRHGIRFEVVPGITAALACAAYAGIPLTHRDHSGSIRFVTAHCRESLEATDWHGLARGRETLAVYMGVAMLGTLRRELVRHGRAASTPVAFVENGSRPEQRVVLGTLEEVEALARAYELRSPALLIVGEVAALGAVLHWFGTPPAGFPASEQRSVA